MTAVIGFPRRTVIDCPSWCERTDHDHDVVDNDNPPLHYGPDFGVLSIEAAGNKKPYALTYESVSDMSASDLNRLAADATAAAEWLGAQP